MDILPINNQTRIIEQTRHGDRELPQKRQPQRKRERNAPRLTYTPQGELEEDHPPKIDVLV
jgi:hypothetical protein